MRRSVVVALAVLVVLVAGAVAGHLVVREGPVEPAIVGGPLTDEADLVERLRHGGLVIYQRHTETTRMGVDPPASLASCDLQRELSDAGRSDAAQIGDAFTDLALPVGRVVSSPFCRVLETAELGFGRFGEAEVTESLLSLATVRQQGDQAAARVSAGVRDLISTPPAPGTNTVLVGSVSNVELVTGVGMEEGGAAVFEPRGDGEYRLLSVIGPRGWPALAAGSGDP